MRPLQTACLRGGGFPSSTRWRSLAGTGLAIVLGLTAGAASGARPPGDGDDPPSVRCLGDTTASLSASPTTVPLGGTTTVRWSVQVPSFGCAALTVRLGSLTVARSGSKVFQPIANSTYPLYAYMSGASRTLAMVSVGVQLPVENGRPAVTITANNQRPLLMQALRTPNALVRVQNHVEIDMSNVDGWEIAGGVTLTGTRTSRLDGPRLYTTSFPSRLFIITGDGVRITGMRFDGGMMGVADGDAPGSIAISMFSRVAVEIDNNEIYGWRGAGVEVRDADNRIDLATNPTTIRVHDNYIHHNQHQRRDGYGVVVSEGAYALIEKNVFDWNRHAIAGDGRPGTGYLLYRNLILKDGGLNQWLPFPGTWVNTHQIDMHGRESCWGYDYYCGPAGEFMDIRYNTVLYTAGTGFKLRGTPSIGADVAHNVFAHDDVWGGFLDDGALAETESGLHEWDNIFGLNAINEQGWCDFDADGVDDRFFATGQTWWYSSGGQRPWVYLNTSTKRRSELVLADFNGDGHCDVAADGMSSSGGTGPWRPLFAAP